MANSTLQDVFRFTSLRAPKTPSKEKWYRKYAKDNFFSYLEEIRWVDRDLRDSNVSPIGATVHDDVFCNKSKQSEIIDNILSLPGFGRKELVGCAYARSEDGSPTIKTIQGLPNEMEYSFSENVKENVGGAEVINLYTWFLSHTIHGITPQLDLATRIIQTHLGNFNKQKLICQLQNALQVSNLSDFVLDAKIENGRITPPTGNTERFRNIKGNLFDLLYFLYISKRKFSVNLDHIIRQIQTLHVIEFLAYDDFTHDYEVERRQEGCNRIASWLYSLFNPTSNSLQKSMVNKRVPIDASLIGLNNGCDISEFTAIGIFVTEPYINSREDLLAFFSVQPIVHPIFSRLNYFHIPFNNIRPVGVSDLKIVKQILVSYEPGEIAHVENVLKGENKERIHRRLDTVETFISDETTRENEATRETQTTDRNEMQRETERTINEAMNFNTDASVHYNGGTIDATLNAGFSWDRSTEESNRNATNFAKEVIQKSAERIMQRTQSLRTTRRTSESEETNRHGLNNVGKDKHIIGIYRYINKRYKAQVFNYGERMMFEFLIPEPSEFYKRTVLAKEKLEQLGDFKEPDGKPEVPSVKASNEVTKDAVIVHWQKYQIETDPTKYIPEIEIGQNEQKDLDIVQGDKANPLPDAENSSNQRPNIQLKAGCVKKIRLSIIFNSHHKTGGWRGKLEINVNGNSNTYLGRTVADNSSQSENIQEFTLDANSPLTLIINTSWIKWYKITIHIFQEPDANLIKAWQDSNFNTIWKAYDKKKDDWEDARSTALKDYNQKKNNHQNKELIKIKGKNPGINKVIIHEELHKHAITLFAKEFDTDNSGDLLQDNPIEYQGELIKKVIGSTKTVRAFVEPEKPSEEFCLIDQFQEECQLFPVTNLRLAKKKGEVVQFLEQAFEWDKISYLLYPYFYGDKSRWMETYDHFDNEPNDTAFVAFLRAGYARVLVPVRDVYRDAVLHFLDTRQLWNGGSAPVIGDNLYLAIHEELRNQTDEYYKAVPEGEPWEYVLPTSLIYLQEDGKLPEFDENFPVNPK